MGYFPSNLFQALGQLGEYAWKQTVNDMLTRVLGIVEDPVGAPQAASTFRKQVAGKIGDLIAGNNTDLTPITQRNDYYGNPIEWLLPAGGKFVNDNITTLRDYHGNNGNVLDIYWNHVLGGVNFAAGNGPPGNRLSFTTATMETFQGSRAGVATDWVIGANCALSSADITVGGTLVGPDGLYHGLQLTASSAATMNCLSPTGIYITPVTVADPITAIGSFKAGGTGRTVGLVLKFYSDTLGATYLSSSDIVGTTGTDSSGAWTTVRATGVVPASAQSCRVMAQVTSPALNEIHYLDAVGLYKLSTGNLSAWSPPQVNQPISGTAYQGSKQYDLYWQADAGAWWRQETAGTAYPNAQSWKKATTTWT